MNIEATKNIGKAKRTLTNINEQYPAIFIISSYQTYPF